MAGRGSAAGGVASHSDLDASVAEARELLADTAEGAVRRARREPEFESCSGTGAERVVGERLLGVGGEQQHPLHDPGRGRRRQSCAERDRLVCTVGAPSPLLRERQRGADEIAARSHLVEEVARQDDAEVLLDRERELDEIERVGGEIVQERDLGREVPDADAEVLGDETVNAALQLVVDGGLCGVREHGGFLSRHGRPSGRSGGLRSGSRLRLLRRGSALACGLTHG